MSVCTHAVTTVRKSLTDHSTVDIEKSLKEERNMIDKLELENFVFGIYLSKLRHEMENYSWTKCLRARLDATFLDPMNAITTLSSEERTLIAKYAHEYVSKDLDRLVKEQEEKKTRVRVLLQQTEECRAELLRAKGDFYSNVLCDEEKKRGKAVRAEIFENYMHRMRRRQECLLKNLRVGISDSERRIKRMKIKLRRLEEAGDEITKLDLDKLKAIYNVTRQHYFTLIEKVDRAKHFLADLTKATRTLVEQLKFAENQNLVNQRDMSKITALVSKVKSYTDYGVEHLTEQKRHNSTLMRLVRNYKSPSVADYVQVMKDYRSTCTSLALASRKKTIARLVLHKHQQQYKSLNPTDRRHPTD